MGEHPELGCTLIDLDERVSPSDQVDMLIAELSARASSKSAEDQVAYRGRSRSVLRLSRLKAAQGEAIEAEPSVRPDGTYLVTGGLSGLGLLTGRWLVESGARALVLVGRRTKTPESEQQLAGMRSQGVKVLVAQADVSRAEEVARVFRDIRTSAMPPLRGVVHCAGVLSDNYLEKQSWEAFEEVLSPKADGAFHLHRQTLDESLDFFVLFSSASSVLGFPSQSNYAAANAFLDGLAYHRRSMGKPALSVNWGGWSSIGMAARVGLSAERAAIDPEEGLRALGYLIRSPSVGPQVVVTGTSWSTYAADSSYVAPLLAALVERPREGASSPKAESSLKQHVEQLAVALRRTEVRNFVRQRVAAVSGKSIEDIPYERPLMELGLDSLMTVELRNKLSAALGGVRLSSTLVFRYPTVAAIADYIGTDVLAVELDAKAQSAADEIEASDDEALFRLIDDKLGQSPSDGL
jgi:acyl carrier protein